MTYSDCTVVILDYILDENEGAVMGAREEEYNSHGELVVREILDIPWFVVRTVLKELSVWEKDIPDRFLVAKDRETRMTFIHPDKYEDEEGSILIELMKNEETITKFSLEMSIGRLESILESLHL